MLGSLLAPLWLSPAEQMFPGDFPVESAGRHWVGIIRIVRDYSEELGYTLVGGS